VQVFETQARHLCQTDQLRRLHTAMASEDPVVPVDEHRIGEAEGLDAGRDLPDLLFRMRPGIACPRGQIADGDHLDVRSHRGLLLICLLTGDSLPHCGRCILRLARCQLWWYPAVSHVLREEPRGTMGLKERLFELRQDSGKSL